MVRAEVAAEHREHGPGVVRHGGGKGLEGGASGLDAVTFPAELEPDVRSHLLHLYGSIAPEVLATAHDEPALLERLDPSGPDIAAQVRYAATHEWATSVEDVIRRRTTLFYRGLAGDHSRDVVAALLAR